MKSLAYRLGNTITARGCTIRLNLSFDVVLRVFDVYADKDLTDLDKLTLTVELLICNRSVRRWPHQEQVSLINDIFKQFIYLGHKHSSSGNDDKHFDFRQDAEYIYSSFMMDYGLDLLQCQGKLDWRKFIALFRGLSERTKIREVMAIRSRTIPEPNKHNSKEIKAIMEAKSFYALEVDAEEAEERFQRSLDRLGNTLEGRARAQ